MNTAKRFLIFVFILILFIGGCAETAEVMTPTPQTSPTVTPAPPDIDGTIDPGEWSRSDQFSISEDSDLYLLQEGRTLYLAVSRSRPGLLGANVFVNQGNIVRILHISAALGTAEYIREGDSWSLTRNFDWQHRTVGNSKAALEERAVYFDREGWSAPNAYTGTPNHLEMQIYLEPETRIAIHLFQSDTTDPFVWPPGLEDDTGKVFSNGLTPQLFLEPDEWYLILE